MIHSSCQIRFAYETQQIYFVYSDTRILSTTNTEFLTKDKKFVTINTLVTITSSNKYRITLKNIEEINLKIKSFSSTAYMI